MDEPAEAAAPTSSATNGKAIASLILGMIGMTGVLFVAAIVAIVLGTRARREIEQMGQKGAALATTGIVLGWTGLAWVVAFGVYFILGMTEVF